MSVASRLDPWLPGRLRSKREAVGPLDLIGLDMAPRRRGGRNAALVPVIAGIVLCALGLVWLRMDVVRMRYAAAEAVAEEQALLDRKQSVTVDLLRLREPTRLAEHARKLGFATPDHVVPLSSVRVTPAESIEADGRRP